jgi:hypothetical protein
MKTIEQIRDIVTRVDGVGVLDQADAARTPQLAEVWLRSFYSAACKTDSVRGQMYRHLDGDVDPDDLAHRSARGANATAGSYGSASLLVDRPLNTAEDWKRLAMALGAVPAAARRAQLARLRGKASLVGEQVLAVFEKAWALGDLDQPSDDEDLKAGDAHTDDTDEEVVAKQRLRAHNAALCASPSKADSRRAVMPASKVRSGSK